MQVSSQTSPQFALYHPFQGLAGWKCCHRGLEDAGVSGDGVVWRGLSEGRNKVTREMYTSAASENASNFQRGGGIKVTEGPEAFQDRAGEEKQIVGKTLQGLVWIPELYRIWLIASLNQTQPGGNNLKALKALQEWQLRAD